MSRRSRTTSSSPADPQHDRVLAGGGHGLPCRQGRAIRHGTPCCVPQTTRRRHRGVSADQRVLRAGRDTRPQGPTVDRRGDAGLGWRPSGPPPRDGCTRAAPGTAGRSGVSVGEGRRLATSLPDGAHRDRRLKRAEPERPTVRMGLGSTSRSSTQRARSRYHRAMSHARTGRRWHGDRASSGSSDVRPTSSPIACIRIAAHAGWVLSEQDDPNGSPLQRWETRS